MQFQPLTEEQIQTASLAPDGIYSYMVITAKEGLSNAGKEKMDMTLKISDDKGDSYLVFTNLSLTKLLKHFCDVNNMQEQYSRGCLLETDCRNKSGGRVMIGIDPEKPDGKGGMYKAKNIVKDYVVAAHGSMQSPAAMKPLPEVKNDLNDELPF